MGEVHTYRLIKKTYDSYKAPTLKKNLEVGIILYDIIVIDSRIIHIR